MKRNLNSIAQDLPPYDLERHSSDIDQLLKTIDEKLSTANRKAKRFQFKRKPRSKATGGTDVHYEQDQSTLDIPETCGKTLNIMNNTASFKNINNCKIRSQIELQNIATSGTLAFQNIKSSIINIKDLPFKGGSIFLTDCKNTNIYLNLPANDKVQIRLHNMQDCRIAIDCPKSTDTKQTVVIENCLNCIFLKESQDYVHIQNFSNLGFSNTSHTHSYEFKALKMSIFNV